MTQPDPRQQLRDLIAIRHLDARAAAAEQERDEATEDRDQARARVSELLAFIGANESLSRAAELTEELALARRDRDDYRVARDVARQTADFSQTAIDRHRQLLAAAGEVRADDADAHPWQEYNAHGNTCHHPGCRMTRDEHEETPNV